VKPLVLALLLSGCMPPACSDDEERAVRQDVRLVVQEEGVLASAAHARLVARGPETLPLIETGFYSANPPARIRLVRLLADLQSAEVRPLLDHLVRRDPDPAVREAAQGAISRLP
jgi:hypothetical protein